jgi:type II secretory pathway pseudopilin PulG
MRMTSTRSTRAGFTLIEAVIVFVMIGLVSAYAVPRLVGGTVRNNVRAARGHIISLYSKARSAAIETNRATTLNYTANTAYITASPRLTTGGSGTLDTIGLVENLNTRYGVTMTWNPAAQITIDPRGFGSLTVTTVWVTRSGVSDSMVVSGFGRVIK